MALPSHTATLIRCQTVAPAPGSRLPSEGRHLPGEGIFHGKGTLLLGVQTPLPFLLLLPPLVLGLATPASLLFCPCVSGWKGVPFPFVESGRWSSLCSVCGSPAVRNTTQLLGLCCVMRQAWFELQATLMLPALALSPVGLGHGVLPQQQGTETRMPGGWEARRLGVRVARRL